MLEFLPPPLINIIFHLAVFLTSLVAFIVGIGLWYNRKINHLGVSQYWRTFIVGVLFYTIAEFADIFTPGLHASLGVHNLITEMTLLVGLSLIFVSLYQFLKDYIGHKASEAESSKTPPTS
jgi:hypothetical protein